jgi:hypothetical protein
MVVRTVIFNAVTVLGHSFKYKISRSRVDWKGWPVQVQNRGCVFLTGATEYYVNLYTPPEDDEGLILQKIVFLIKSDNGKCPKHWSSLPWSSQLLEWSRFDANCYYQSHNKYNWSLLHCWLIKWKSLGKSSVLEYHVYET